MSYRPAIALRQTRCMLYGMIRQKKSLLVMFDFLRLFSSTPRIVISDCL